MIELWVWIDLGVMCANSKELKTWFWLIWTGLNADFGMILIGSDIEFEMNLDWDFFGNWNSFIPATQKIRKLICWDTVVNFQQMELLANSLYFPSH